MKVVKEFDGVELYWLLNGKGTYPIAPDNAVAYAPSIEQREATDFPPPVSKSEPAQKTKQADASKKIERIVVFYSDGTFKAYSP